jgi:hypothetical protein
MPTGGALVAEMMRLPHLFSMIGHSTAALS